MPDAPLLLLHPHARSAWIISQLAPDRPWRASNLRVRCTLILSVTIADLLYSFMQLVAASIDIANAEAAAAPFCWVMGPLMYFSIFSLYISIANIAHYSFHRLTRRTGDRSDLLWWYLLVLVCLAALLTGSALKTLNPPATATQWTDTHTILF